MNKEIFKNVEIEVVYYEDVIVTSADPDGVTLPNDSFLNPGPSNNN